MTDRTQDVWVRRVVFDTLKEEYATLTTRLKMLEGEVEALQAEKAAAEAERDAAKAECELWKRHTTLAANSNLNLLAVQGQLKGDLAQVATLQTQLKILLDRDTTLVERIHAWQQDETQGYDTAIELLGEIEGILRGEG